MPICQDCGNFLADSARTCPQCGSEWTPARMAEAEFMAKGCLAVVLVPIVFVLSLIVLALVLYFGLGPGAPWGCTIGCDP